MKLNKKSTEKIVKLSCMERIAILDLLQMYKEGNFITFKTLKELGLRIGFTSDEIIRFSLQQTGGATTWNELGKIPKEFPLNEMEVKLIRDQLLALDGASRLTQLHTSVYEMFV